MQKPGLKQPKVHLLPTTLNHRYMYAMAEQMHLALEASSHPPISQEKRTLIHKRADEIRIERDAIADLTEGATQPVKVKHSTKSYCGCCLRNYKPLELVQYIVNDNDTVCTPCSTSTEALRTSEKAHRVFVPDTDDYDFYRDTEPQE
ncbi:hypothetical protein OS242_10330 [Tumebacillus sp. DT12]|uniref:DksA C4-type domain-containing protein n=1 Tax=Tumebacillus lacus TaxID=2995335 RepID=A0ABT3X0D5_9BACL|nr:hypothetical protein [Tumebacillus lacus]MCX7570360.1 hypothetical protein [Tumebacillus lacus]